MKGRTIGSAGVILMLVVASWCCSLALSGNGTTHASARTPSAINEPRPMHANISLSIRGGIGRIFYTVTNNGSETVSVSTELQVGGFLKSSDGIGFYIQGGQQRTIGIYKARVFAPFTADLAAGKSLLERTGFIIGVFFYFTS